jgi:2-methylaconitate cis-trans-isomerase PrpF
MIKTAFTEVMGIEHPIALGGLGGGHTNTAITSAVGIVTLSALTSIDTSV